MTAVKAKSDAANAVYDPTYVGVNIPTGSGIDSAEKTAIISFIVSKYDGLDDSSQADVRAPAAHLADIASTFAPFLP